MRAFHAETEFLEQQGLDMGRLACQEVWILRPGFGDQRYKLVSPGRDQSFHVGNQALRIFGLVICTSGHSVL